MIYPHCGLSYAIGGSISYGVSSISCACRFQLRQKHRISIRSAWSFAIGRAISFGVLVIRNSCRVEYRQKHRILTRSELSCSTRHRITVCFMVRFRRWRWIALRGIIHKTIFLVRSRAGRSIAWNGTVRSTVSHDYLGGISGEHFRGLSYSTAQTKTTSEGGQQIRQIHSRDFRKAVMRACLFRAVIIFRSFGIAKSLAEWVLIFAARNVKIVSSQGVTSRIAWVCDFLLDRAILNCNFFCICTEQGRYSFKNRQRVRFIFADGVA